MHDLPINNARTPGNAHTPGNALAAPAPAGNVDVPGNMMRRYRIGYPHVTMSRPPDPSVRRLTPREREVALLVADGLSDAAIAERLNLKLSTVGTCVQRVQRRLHLTSRTEIVVWVAERRVSEDPNTRLRRVGPRDAI
jgi:DNA-binding NarL/FixJ family response regulator